MNVEDDGDGNVRFHFQRGGIEKSFTVRLPRLKDKGIYRETGEYKKGDGVTSNGDFWIAQKDAPLGRPGMDAAEWRLAVRKGRDFRPQKDAAK